MGFLQGKQFLITGLRDERSLSYGVAKAMHQQGARLAFSYRDDSNKEITKKLAETFDSDVVFKCDVKDDLQIEKLAEYLKIKFVHIDGFVHSMAWAPFRGFIKGFTEATDREVYQQAHEVSSYSLIALTRTLLPLMKDRPASIIAMSYVGSQVAVPIYNVMGSAKAALEANVRYLANDLGPMGIRVNTISPGPHATKATSIGDSIYKVLENYKKVSPLRRNINIDEVGNVAAFLSSDLASSITGQTIYTDGGYSISDSNGVR